jgi:hypothetical protein
MMSTAEVYQWIEDNYGMIISCVERSRAVRSRTDEFDELVSECIDKIPGIIATYTPSMGTKLSTHVFANLKWYIYKWKHRRKFKAWQRGCERGAKPETYTEDHYTSQDIAVLLSRIEELVPCKRTRWLITTLCAQELPLEKCAEHLGVDNQTAYVMYRDAMVLLKDNLRE